MAPEAAATKHDTMGSNQAAPIASNPVFVLLVILDDLLGTIREMLRAFGGLHDEGNAKAGEDGNYGIHNPHGPGQSASPRSSSRNADKTKHVNNRGKAHRESAEK